MEKTEKPDIYGYDCMDCGAHLDNEYETECPFCGCDDLRATY